MNDLPSICKYSSCLRYADDAKLFKRIKTKEDTCKLQEDIDRLSQWCSSWKITLNIKKCSVISFTKKKSPCITDYTINNTHLERVYKVKDLGVIFSSNLDFGTHISTMINKAFRTLRGAVILSLIFFHSRHYIQGT